MVVCVLKGEGGFVGVHLVLVKRCDEPCCGLECGLERRDEWKDQLQVRSRFSGGSCRREMQKEKHFIWRKCIQAQAQFW